jgi:hypothetical protein
VAEHERPHIRLEGRDKKVLHALWSRSGKLLLHAASTSKTSESAEVSMELTPDQVELLERFLHDGP